MEDVSYCHSTEIDAYLRIKIGSLEAPHVLDLPLANTTTDLVVSVQCFVNARPIGPPVKSSYRPSLTYTWNEWLVLPVKFWDVTKNTCFGITVLQSGLNSDEEVIAGTTFFLFSNNAALRTGRQKLFLYSKSHPDPQWPSSTNSKRSEKDVIDCLEKSLKRYERGDLSHIPWLDRLVMAEVEKAKHTYFKSSPNAFLYVDVPKFDFPILYHQNASEPSLGPVRNPEIALVYDPEMMKDNLVEAKHRRLVRSHRSGPLDRELKPNAKIRDELNVILRYPPSRELTPVESDLLWKFRFYLTRDKHALTKFLKCVDWNDSVESKQAVNLLIPSWVDIEVDDALELLGPSFTHPSVRQYAVRQLYKASDNDLAMYLLQLVQAIKFEQLTEKGAYESPLVDFLTSRAIRNANLGNHLHWYLMVECDDAMYAPIYAKVSYFYMTRMVESLDGAMKRDQFRRQSELIERLCLLVKELRTLKEPRLKKIEWLKGYLSDPKNGLNSFPPLPLPLDAIVHVTGVISDQATVFKSNLSPIRLTFKCIGESTYTVIFKSGDDLRQDQLIMQVISLMDNLLQKENLDLKLTPYKILATGGDHGLIQYISALPLAAILSAYNNNLQAYLRESSSPNQVRSLPSTNTETYGIDSTIMDAYVKSCAGYCVITYLLGIGDRHLDNLMLSPDGRLFHIDFGFILGRDPKPFAPPMKLCKEMVDAMGGTSSTHYAKFKSLCYTAFMILRKSANLILNLFALMVDANVPDIRQEPDKAVEKVLEKFRLDLDDEEAIQYFQGLINDSVNAMFPQLMETVHKWAQYWRN